MEVTSCLPVLITTEKFLCGRVFILVESKGGSIRLQHHMYINATRERYCTRWLEASNHAGALLHNHQNEQYCHGSDTQELLLLIVAIPSPVLA